MMHTAESYRREWATLTGRPESDVYIPEALRGPGNRVVLTQGSTQGLGGTVTATSRPGVWEVTWDDGIDGHVATGQSWWKWVR